MVNVPFELEWYGGMPAARLRRRRGDLRALPWGTLDARSLSAPVVLAAQESFTEGELLRLARIAEREIDAAFAPWTRLETDATPAEDEESLAVVGFVKPGAFLEAARHALRSRVARPLARFGIEIDEALLDRLAPI